MTHYLNLLAGGGDVDVPRRSRTPARRPAPAGAWSSPTDRRPAARPSARPLRPGGALSWPWADATEAVVAWVESGDRGMATLVVTTA